MLRAIWRFAWIQKGASLMITKEELLTLLRQECQIMDIERDLDDKVNARMDKGQREYLPA